MKLGYKVATTVVAVGVIAAVVIYNVIIDKSVDVVTQEIEIENLPKEFEGFTILQLTDLHSKYFGEDQKNIIDLINNLNFDAIAITGDMQNRQESTCEPFLKLVRGIKNKQEIFYTPGNHGPMVYNDEASFNSITMENSNTEIISNNSGEKKGLPNRVLTQAGLELKSMGVKFLDKAYPITRGGKSIWISELIFSDTFKEFTDEKYKKGDIKIALTHYPMSKAVYEGEAGKSLGNYDLILAGHYHGGQWKIPFLGALFIPDLNENGWFPSKERVSGLTNWGGFKQYVSAGLGAGGPFKISRFRFFNKPEINLIKLVNKKI